MPKIAFLVDLPAELVEAAEREAHQKAATRKRKRDDDPGDASDQEDAAIPELTDPGEQLRRNVVHHLAVEEMKVERLSALPGVACSSYLQKINPEQPKAALPQYMKTESAASKLWRITSEGRYRLNPEAYLGVHPGWDWGSTERRTQAANSAIAKSANLAARKRAAIRKRFAKYAEDEVLNPYDQVGIRLAAPARNSGFMGTQGESIIEVVAGLSIPSPSMAPPQPDAPPAASAAPLAFRPAAGGTATIPLALQGLEPGSRTAYVLTGQPQGPRCEAVPLVGRLIRCKSPGDGAAAGPAGADADGGSDGFEFMETDGGFTPDGASASGGAASARAPPGASSAAAAAAAAAASLPMSVRKKRREEARLIALSGGEPEAKAAAASAPKRAAAAAPPAGGAGAAAVALPSTFEQLSGKQFTKKVLVDLVVSEGLALRTKANSERKDLLLARLESLYKTEGGAEGGKQGAQLQDNAEAPADTAEPSMQGSGGWRTVVVDPKGCKECSNVRPAEGEAEALTDDRRAALIGTFKWDFTVEQVMKDTELFARLCRGYALLRRRVVMAERGKIRAFWRDCKMESVSLLEKTPEEQQALEQWYADSLSSANRMFEKHIELVEKLSDAHSKLSLAGRLLACKLPPPNAPDTEAAPPGSPSG